MAIKELTQATFEDAIKDNNTVIIDFWAPWCGPCRQFAPVFEKASEKFTNIEFAKINTEEEQELAGALRIRSIPTLMVFREKVLMFSQAGALSPNQLDELLTKVQEIDMEKVHQEIATAQAQADEQGKT